MWIIQGLMALCIVFGMTDLALAEVQHEIRFKLGSAPGISEFEVASGPTDNVDAQGGGNFQAEYAITVGGKESSVAFVGTGGIFVRQHKGHMAKTSYLLTSAPTDIKYGVGGGAVSAGICFKADEKLRFEGRAGLDFGIGNVDLSTPGHTWNDTEAGGYVAFNVIAGTYYAFSKPGMLLGLELGWQTYSGGFQIWSNATQDWADGTVRGDGGIVNFVLGMRF